MPGERHPQQSLRGSQTGTIGGGGPEARPSSVRAVKDAEREDNVDDENAEQKEVRSDGETTDSI
jgi:hypothetical protein